MKIAVLGTGNVGTTIGSKLVELGHEVKMGSRTVGNEKALAFVKAAGDKASHGTFEDAAAFGEIIFNCTKGEVSIIVLKLAGAENLKGKIVIDVSNPLHASDGMPPSLFISNTDSLGEEIQHLFPEAHVVKTLNTMWCGLMVNPRMLHDEHTVFICGDNAEAKNKTKSILKEFGWRDAEILDLGDITNARGVESYLPLWLRTYLATKNGAFNIKVVTA